MRKVSAISLMSFFLLMEVNMGQVLGFVQNQSQYVIHLIHLFGIAKLILVWNLFAKFNQRIV